MLAIDPKYIGGIVDVTASEERRSLKMDHPGPRYLEIKAYCTVSRWRMASHHRCPIAESGREHAPKDQHRSSVRPSGLRDAYLVVEPIAAANGKIIGHVDYSLHQEASDTAPIWTLNCFDLNGGLYSERSTSSPRRETSCPLAVVQERTGELTTFAGFPARKASTLPTTASIRRWRASTLAPPLPTPHRVMTERGAEMSGLP